MNQQPLYDGSLEDDADPTRVMSSMPMDQVAPPQAPLPAAGQPATVATPSRGPRRALLLGLVGGGVLSALMIAAGGWAIYKATRPSLARSFPVKMDALPQNTVQVSWGQIRAQQQASGQGDQLLLASAYSALFCGGVDVATALMELKAADLSALQKCGLEKLGVAGAHQEPLLCGKEIAARQTDRWVVSASVEQEKSAVLARSTPVSGTIDRLSGFSSSSKDGLATLCRGADGKCAPQGPVGAGRDGVWWAGSAAGVAALASPPAKESSELAEFASKLRPSDAGELRRRPPSIELGAPCVLVAPAHALGPFVRACLPDATVPPALALELRASAFQYDRPGSKRLRFEFTYWARSDEAAAKIEAAVRSYTASSRPWVQAHASELTKLSKANGQDTGDSPWAAVIGTFVRAVSAPEIERNADLVRVLMSAEVDETELKGATAALTARPPRADKIEAVLRALMDGKQPAQAELEPFVDKDVSTWILARQACQADCDKLLAKVSGLRQSPGFNDFAIAGYIEDGWREERCRSRKLTDASSQCLDRASTVAELEACSLPMDPEYARLHKKLQGKWTEVKTAGSGKAPSLEYKDSSITADSFPGGVKGEARLVWYANHQAKMRIGLHPLQVRDDPSKPDQVEMAFEWTDEGKPKAYRTLQRVVASKESAQ